MTETHARAHDLLVDYHKPIAEFARTSYQQDGRGAVTVEFPDVPPGKTVMGVTNLHYHTLGDLPLDEDLAITRHMIETYNPDTQCVVVACIEGYAPISVKLRLQAPVLAPEPKEVQ